jgi:pantoate--beta-alanine ligase
MRTLHTIAEVRDALLPEARAGRSVGLVPTMGALHAGHLELLRRAREEQDVLVVSLFVNPAQFEDARDLAAYPRDEARDARLAAEAGADLLFAPGPDELYPPGFATQVTVGGPAEGLEGEHRGPGHFRGVATVVLKLLNVVRPDVAYFGQKDAQQLAVVRRMVRDLDVPVRIAAVQTVREPDGLALSSRNARLSPADRARALALRDALRAAEAAVREGERDGAHVLAAARAAMAPHGVEPEYLALVHPDTFAPVARVEGDVLLAVAARVGGVRLIDNQPLSSSNGRPR